MSTKFYAVNRETGERWKPDEREGEQYLMMYDSGSLAVVTIDYYSYIEPLNMEIWKPVYKHNLEGLINESRRYIRKMASPLPTNTFKRIWEDL